MRSFAAVLLALTLGACAITHETSVVVGKTRPPITSDQVKLYTTPPAKYDEIAIISADAAHDFMGKQELMNLSIVNLKIEAAKVGANGIILDNVGDFYVGSSGIAVVPAAARGRPVAGVVSANARSGKQASGKAIYVIQE